MKKSEFKEYVNKFNKSQVIFDLDETLVTLKINWNYWIEDMVRLFDEHNIAYNNLDFAPCENELIERFGEKMRSKIIEINYRHEKKYYTGYIKHEHILDILDIASKAVTVHLWTSNDKRTIESVLEELKIQDLFKTIVTRNDVKFIKPDPYGFKIINKEGFAPSQFLFIGDSSADRGAAESSEIEFMHVSEIED